MSLTRETLVVVLLIAMGVFISSTVFFGVVFSNQTRIFYMDLIKLNNENYVELLNKYGDAWVQPNLIGFISAILTILCGLTLLYLLRGKKTI